MGKKKPTSVNKTINKGGKSDTATSVPDKHSNKKSKKKTNNAAAAAAPPISGSTVLLISISALVVVGAVVVLNKDVQNFLVSLTPLGSNPLESILAKNGGSNTAGKNSATTNQDDAVEVNKDNKPVHNDNENDSEKSGDRTAKKDSVDKSKDGVNDDTNKSSQNKRSTDNIDDTNKVSDKEKDSEPVSDDSSEEVIDAGDNNTTGKQKKKKVKRTDYEKHEITNKADFKIKKKLDAAEQLKEEDKLQEALNKFNSLLTSNPESPRALWGKAQVTDTMAERQRSNKLLEESMTLMDRALRMPDTPKMLKYKIGDKLAERQSFRGWEGKAAKTWRYLMEMFPEEVTFQQKYGTCFMVMGKNDRARDVFKMILDKFPDDSYSLIHLGFIYKVVDLNYKEGIELLQRGIEMDKENKVEGKFFYHLGDAFIRINESEKAAAVYRQGAERGLFLSQYQRSLYNADTPLTGRPWWTPEETTYENQLKVLEKNWKTIREEGFTQLNAKTGSFLPEEENLRETGDWKQFMLFQRGRKVEENCKKVPKTCALLEQIPDAAGCSRGQIKYSVMHPGVHVWPHTGPTNCRIRAHLGLKVPAGPRIRVGNDTRTWIEGKFIIFDDSFEHEVWHDGEEFRLVLIVDFWHPELTEDQKRNLSPI